MNNILNNVKRTINDTFAAGKEVAGYVLHKTEEQLDNPEHSEEWVCATDPGVAYVGEIKSGDTTYGAIINNDRSHLTVVDHNGDFVAETFIEQGKLLLGNKNLTLSKQISKGKVYFRIEIDTEAKSAPTMTSDFVKRVVNNG